MTMHRLSIKFFVTDPTAVDLEALIPVLHAWVRESAVPGLLIDVADYRHMTDGPGVVLVGHDADYALDMTAGKPGLLHTQKHRDGDLAARLPQLLHDALVACRALADQTPLRFAADAFEIKFLDRLSAPNSDETFEQLRPQVEAALGAAFGEGLQLTRNTADPRSCLTIDASATSGPDVNALIDRLAPAPA